MYNLGTNDRVLITGTGGMLGRAMAEILKQGGVTVLAPVRGDLDLQDQAAVLRYFEEHRPTHVIHAAARVFGLGGNMKFPGDMYYMNASMNSNVIEASRAVGVKKVTGVGTGAVYPVKFDGEYLTEDQVWEGPPHGSEWAYAQAKRGMLAHLHTYREQFGMDYSYTICGNLYGPHDLFNIEYGHVIPSLVSKFARAQRESSPVSIWGTGVAVRDFTHVRDAARAILTVHAGLTGPVNIASGNIHTIRDVVDCLDDLTGKAIPIEWDSTKPDGQGRRFYDLTKLRSLGFEPEFDLATGLADTWRWFTANYPNVRT